MSRLSVSLAPAFIDRRLGEFADQPDVLYKKSHFLPAPGSRALPTNVVDVRKAFANWQQRRPLLENLLGNELHSEAEDVIGDVQRVAADEYFAHEAGHCMGHDTEWKYTHGYFRPAGKISWPLVYLEEFRADMLSFGFAADLLHVAAAAAVFLYNVLLRFGVHIQGRARGAPDPYGPIPMLLYAALSRVGWLKLGISSSPSLSLESLVARDLVTVMRICSDSCLRELVLPELAASTGTDAALVAAWYYRRILKDQVIQSSFERMCASARHE
jgi:hypothetical protein